jgi:hypothetical protein
MKVEELPLVTTAYLTARMLRPEKSFCLLNLSPPVVLKSASQDNTSKLKFSLSKPIVMYDSAVLIQGHSNDVQYLPSPLQYDVKPTGSLECSLHVCNSQSSSSVCTWFSKMICCCHIVNLNTCKLKKQRVAN